MRKLIISEFISLDGVMENPQWTFSYGSEEQEHFKFAELKAADALMLGRTTYEGFAEAWPNMVEQTGEYGEMMNGYAKYVVSTTLEQTTWSNSSLIKGDLAQEVSKLKEQPGRDILVFGSRTLAQSLMQLGLVDEYQLLVFPILLGSGQRLFENVGEEKTLELVDSKRFSSGVMALTYRPASQ
ncbi:dihydrofolate reductase family protein [Paenibacillus odorifer]|uniref:dihydrofolate reductase family protein n=1 Tax=Paenibacillus odorifer TaxID=189426 RepID=UPI00096CCC3F|nr:dihydrofolate reductase family protein [Paenibacillus odorifer]OMD60332.1 pyrimidine reductase [Paenibacillus odorifer]